MKTGQKLYWMVALAAFLAMTAGCGGTSLRPIDEEIARSGADLHKDTGQRIEGYVLSDGIAHEYIGRARLTGTDSLALWTDAASGQTSASGNRSQAAVPGPVFPLTAVEALKVHKSGNTFLIVGTLLVVGAAATYAVAASSMDFETTSGSSWSLVK